MRISTALTVLLAGGFVPEIGVVAAESPVVTVDEILRAEPLSGDSAPGPIPEPADIFALSPEMKGFLDRHVNPGATDIFKLQQLIDAIMDPQVFGLVYDDRTRTAAATFRERRGNCLSFSIMFVVLAREVELPVEFEEVDIPPDWSLDNDVFVLSRHVNVKINLGSAGVHVVDFNISDFKTTYDVQPINDRRAVAHFYNNLGVEQMQAGNTATAVELLRRAMDADGRRFSPAWTNLGTLYRRGGFGSFAETAYLQALKADKRDLVAMSNLVALYDASDRHDRAEVYRKRVREHRLGNPYYRFRLAQDAFFERDFDTAIEHLKHAIRRQKHNDRFVFLLGLCHLMQGNDAEAKKWFARAEELAAGDAQRKRYSTKIESLMAAVDAAD